jgi:Amt family ammonium transporter
MQCFAITAVVTVLWTIFGYSLAFDKVGMQAGEDGIHAFRGTLQSIYEGYYAR